MSNGPSQYGFENLTQSGLLKTNSKDDKNVTLSIDTFGGNTGMSVWTGSGGRPWKINLPRKTIANIVILLRKMRADPRPQREPIMINMWDAEAKRMKQIGQIGIGIDEGLVFQIDIAHNDLSGGRHTFPLKPDGRFDFSNTTLTEKESVEGVLDWLINALSIESLVAERLTSFKRPAGGNRGGGGGNYNRGGNSNQGQQGSFSNNNNNNGGGVDYENDLHV